MSPRDSRVPEFLELTVKIVLTRSPRWSPSSILANDQRSTISVVSDPNWESTLFTRDYIYIYDQRDEWPSFLKERYKYFTREPYITTNLCYTSITNRRWPSKNGRASDPRNSAGVDGERRNGRQRETRLGIRRKLGYLKTERARSIARD